MLEEEEIMKVLKPVFILAAVLVVVIVSGAFLMDLSVRHQTIRDYVVEVRAGWALDKIRELTADQIITDEVIRAAFRNNRWGNLRGVSWAAREAVFEKHQCYIFSIGYDGVENVCSTARYSEGLTDRNVWYEKKGIPVSIAPTIAEMRKELYRIARTFLANPDNLRSVFEAKKDVILNEYGRLSGEKKREFQGVLLTAIGAFEEFRDDDLARVKYARYIELENGAHCADGSLNSFSAWRQSGEELGETVTDKDLYLFAGRRHAEGGDILISAYLEVMYNLKTAIAKK